MTTEIDLERLVAACADDSADAAIRLEASLEPIGGIGDPVKPPVYAGGQYQTDKRWESADSTEATPVIVIDNHPSQANRLEAALQRRREDFSLPELVLDLSEIDGMPVHLPGSISSWQFPHRNADAYLRDARLDGVDFTRTDIGRSLFDATPWRAAALMSWFPQALLYGFWQSHLGKKRANTKLARAWVSEIIGWGPATEDTRVLGVKGDPLNLSTEEVITSNPNDRENWQVGKANVEGGKPDKLSEMGHGQVPFPKDTAPAPAAVSFRRVSQTATVSFAQLRQLSFGPGPAADAAGRALLVCMGLAAHHLAFGRAFALRSGADLVPVTTSCTWLGATGASSAPVPTDVESLLRAAHERADAAGVALDGWGVGPVRMTPKDNLASAIRATWPLLDD